MPPNTLVFDLDTIKEGDHLPGSKCKELRWLMTNIFLELMKTIIINNVISDFNEQFIFVPDY